MKERDNQRIDIREFLAEPSREKRVKEIEPLKSRTWRGNFLVCMGI
jgi:hypothetical protein